jgi:hypothetical protein
MREGRRRVSVRGRVRVRGILRDRGVDCTDVGVEPLTLLLDRSELSIVSASADRLAHRLMLALPTHVELLLSDESDQCVASLEDDRQRGVSVAEERSLRVRRVSRQELQHTESLLGAQHTHTSRR